MSRIDDFIYMLHADPETLPGNPSNKQLLAERPDWIKAKITDTEISEANRVGLLEMWRLRHIQDLISRLDPPELQDLHAEARVELYDSAAYASEYDDLRFITIAAGKALAVKQYTNKEI